MASRAWTAFERLVAQLSGGIRSWFDEDRIDVIVVGEEQWAVECKYRKDLTIPQIERWLAYNKIKADKRGMRNAIAVKRKAGRGHPTPILLITLLAED